MKHIVLLGVPRAGKSTFAKMIKERFPIYNWIETDVIGCAYREALEKEAEKTGKILNLKEILESEVHQQLAKNVFTQSIKSEPEIRFILDAWDLSLEEAKQYQKEGKIVIAFGYPNQTPQQLYQTIKEYETKKDWTYIEPYWRLNLLTHTWVENSIQLENDCKDNSIKFVDTSNDREKVLKELLKWVEEQNKC